MSDLTISEIKDAAPSWGPAELLAFLQSELDGDARKTALEAVLVEHAPTLLEALDAKLNPPAPPEPPVQKVAQIAKNALTKVGELVMKDGQLILADIDQIEAEWARFSSANWYVYVTGSPEDMERIKKVRRAKDSEILQDGTWRLDGGNTTQAKARASQISQLANQKKLHSIKAVELPAESARALAADATRDGTAAIVTRKGKKPNAGFTIITAKHAPGTVVEVFEDPTSGRMLLVPKG